jgi:hypothetical protein
MYSRAMPPTSIVALPLIGAAMPQPALGFAGPPGAGALMPPSPLATGVPESFTGCAASRAGLVPASVAALLPGLSPGLLPVLPAASLLALLPASLPLAVVLGPTYASSETWSQLAPSWHSGVSSPPHPSNAHTQKKMNRFLCFMSASQAARLEPTPWHDRHTETESKSR